MTALDDLLARCCAEMTRRAEVAGPGQPELSSGASAFAAALASAAPINGELERVPVAGCLSQATPAELLGPTQQASAEISWVPSPRTQDRGTEVALGLVNPVRTLGDVTCGIMLLGPGQRYPEHSHPPQEIYLPISGDGMWRFGGAADYRTLEPNELVYNNPGDTHGAYAKPDEPLVAMYVLWP